MPRYIDAEDFKHLINASSLYDTEEWVKVMDLLADTPTADVRENVHARWKIYNICDYAYRPTGRRVCYCSNCGQLTPEWRKLLEEPLWYFCPKCGAVMDEGGEDG